MNTDTTILKICHVLCLLIYLGLAVTEAEWDYQRLARMLHNQYRSKHFAKPLYSTKSLHKRAEECARYYVRLGRIDHSCPYVSKAGENIWAYWGGRQTDTKLTLKSIDGWYMEEKRYLYLGQQTGTGHFTQMVWRGTSALGFGLARAGNMVVAVGIYWPAGNYFGEYTKNVHRPRFTL